MLVLSVALLMWCPGQDSLLADAQNPTPAQAHAPKAKAKDEGDADFGGMFDDDDEEEEEEEEKPVVQVAKPGANGGDKGKGQEKGKEKEKGGFEDSLVKGMFGDSSSDEEEDPAERLAKQIAALPLPSAPPVTAPKPTRPTADIKQAENPVEPPPRLPSPDIAVPDALLAPPPLPVGPSTAPTSKDVAATEPPAPPPPRNQGLAGVPRNWSGKKIGRAHV